MSKKIVLKDAFKGYTLDQDKVVTPEQTVQRFKDRLRKVDADILEKTVRIDNGRLDIPVYFSVCGRDAERMIGTKKQMGKGGTPAQAEASAVMELAERFSFFSFSKTAGNFIVGEYANLKDKALPFEAIAKSVHDSSDELEKSRRIFSELPLKWTMGYNLTKGEEVLIPFDWFFAINEFNGPSAGNCVEEAISQGICELVERHVCSIVSRGKMKTPAIHPDSVTDPLVLEMLGKYRKAGVKLFISDLSCDMGIPSVGVLAYDPSTFPEKSEIVWTAGTTPDPQKALSRALTEVAQLAGDFNSGSNYVASGLPKFRELSEADFVMQPGSTIDISVVAGSLARQYSGGSGTLCFGPGKKPPGCAAHRCDASGPSNTGLLHHHSGGVFQRARGGNQRGNVLGQTYLPERKSVVGAGPIGEDGPVAA